MTSAGLTTLINGTISSTMQRLRLSKSTNNALRSFGLGDDAASRITFNYEGGGWRAAARQFTRRDVLKAYAKEALGEGIEEWS
jgi:hypothetical protein